MTPNMPMDWSQPLEKLLPAAVQRFDPQRFFYLQTLSRRAAHAQLPTRQLLETRLTQDLSALQTAYAAACKRAQSATDAVAKQQPQAATALQALLDAGDCTAVQQRIAALHRTAPVNALAELNAYLALHMPTLQAADAGSASSTAPNPPSELKAVQHFRSSWTRIYREKQLGDALEQAPKNAGPINSHILMLRSLALMRDLAPGYLHRFMAYADTLLCLDQQQPDRVESVKARGDKIGGRKTRTRPKTPQLRTK